MSRQSTKELVATLPSRAPNTEHAGQSGTRHRNSTSTGFEGLAEIDATALAQLEKGVNEGGPEDECSGGNSALAREASRFAGRSLRQVYEHHVKARDRDRTVHPLFFIVADNAEWKANGLLIIHLDCGYLEGGKEGGDCVRVGRCGVDWAGTWGVNIIGNMDWMDLKEMEETDWDGDDPYGNEDGDGDDDDTSSAKAEEAGESTAPK